MQFVDISRNGSPDYSRFLEYGICHIRQTWHIPYPSRHFKGIIWVPGLTRQPSSAVNTRNPQTRSVFDQVVDLFSNWAISAWSSTQHISLGGAISFIFPTLLGIVPGNGRDGNTMEKLMIQPVLNPGSFTIVAESRTPELLAGSMEVSEIPSFFIPIFGQKIWCSRKATLLNQIQIIFHILSWIHHMPFS